MRECDAIRLLQSPWRRIRPAIGGSLLACALVGCGDGTSASRPGEPEPPDRITAENMDQYLLELEAEISAEEAALRQRERQAASADTDARPVDKD